MQITGEVADGYLVITYYQAAGIGTCNRRFGQNAAVGSDGRITRTIDHDQAVIVNFEMKERKIQSKK